MAGRQATETLTLVGIPSDPAKTRLQSLTDAAAFTTAYHRTSFHVRDKVLYADLELVNSGPYALNGPLYLGITNISDPRVYVYRPDGVSREGIPYFDLTALLGDGVLAPGETTTGAIALAFANPHRVRFTYDLVLVGATNRPPEFATVPLVSTPQDRPYRYAAQALDPDGDAVAHSLTAHPAGMTIDAAGSVTWAADQVRLGNHAVTVRATDSRGGASEQSFTLTVHAPLPNRPPVFTTVPVVTAYVGRDYTYDADALDLDGDTLTYALSQTPFSEMLIDPATGLISGWTPQADQVGDHEVSVSITDNDPVNEGAAEQRFVVRVQAEPGNQSPTIISAPIDEVLAGTEYRYQVVAVDPDRDDQITYSLALDTIPSGLTLDQDSGLIVWPTPVDGRQISVRATDGRGGFEVQRVPLTVTAAASGSITGTVFGDADGDGRRDGGETGAPDWIVYADRNGNRRRDADEPRTATGAAGQYVLGGLLAGTYTVLLERPGGWVQTAPANPAGVTIAPGIWMSRGPISASSSETTPTARPCSPLRRPPRPPWRTRWTTRRQPTIRMTTRWSTRWPTAPQAWPSIAGRAAVWTPGLAETGIVYATLRVHDGRGGVALQPLTLTVTGSNQRPCSPANRCACGIGDGAYAYDADAQDPSNPNESLRYWLDQASLLRGMSADPSTGELTWPHPAGPVRGHGLGCGPRRSDSLPVLPTGSHRRHRKPAAASGCGHRVHHPRRGALRPSRPDPGPRRRSPGLHVAEPERYRRAGPLRVSESPRLASAFLSWTPSLAQVNDPALPHEFRVQINDGPGGHTVDQFYRLHVVAHTPANGPPQIISTPRRTALVGEVYAFLSGPEPGGTQQCGGSWSNPRPA